MGFYRFILEDYMPVDVVEELFENAQFILLLKDQVERMVGETIVQRNQTRSTGDMVGEINALIEKIIEFNVKGELVNATSNIHHSLLQAREEAQKQIQQMLESVREENLEFKKSIQQVVRDVRKEAMEDRLRLDQKISSINKNSAQQINNRIRDITNNLDENFPKSMKSLKLLPFSSKALPELDSTCSYELKTRLESFQKTIEEIEAVLMDLENRLHERYQVNIASLWTVVAEIQGKLLTEEKVQSKLDDLRGSILSNSEVMTVREPQEKVGMSKKWLIF